MARLHREGSGLPERGAAGEASRVRFGGGPAGRSGRMTRRGDGGLVKRVAGRTWFRWRSCWAAGPRHGSSRVVRRPGRADRVGADVVGVLEFMSDEALVDDDEVVELFRASAPNWAGSSSGSDRKRRACAR